jgi:hypothetical protein
VTSSTHVSRGRRLTRLVPIAPLGRSAKSPYTFSKATRCMGVSVHSGVDWVHVHGGAVVLAASWRAQLTAQLAVYAGGRGLEAHVRSGV